jgi:hypothetical protein
MPELFLGGRVDPASGERIDDDVRIKTDELTTHGVIVGMTGSGKTGLGVVLIEEVLRAGLPALLIDPKGDLTNLALTFPSLAPADFRPWIDEAQASSAGQSPDEFAAAQATQWAEGLAGWEQGMRRLARCPNVVVKLSGYGMTDNRWTVDSIRPFVRGPIEWFGPERAMFGSNFPVDRLMADYDRLWDAYRALVSDLSPDEQTALLRGTAERVYRI